MQFSPIVAFLITALIASWSGFVVGSTWWICLFALIFGVVYFGCRKLGVILKST